MDAKRMNWPYADMPDEKEIEITNVTPVGFLRNPEQALEWVRQFASTAWSVGGNKWARDWKIEVRLVPRGPLPKAADEYYFGDAG